MEGLLGDEAGGALRLEAAIYPFHLGHAEPGKEGNGGHSQCDQIWRNFATILYVFGQFLKT